MIKQSEATERRNTRQMSPVNARNRMGTQLCCRRKGFMCLDYLSWQGQWNRLYVYMLAAKNGH